MALTGVSLTTNVGCATVGASVGAAVAWVGEGAVADGTAITVALLTSATVCVSLQPLKGIIKVSSTIANTFFDITSSLLFCNRCMARVYSFQLIQVRKLSLYIIRPNIHYSPVRRRSISIN